MKKPISESKYPIIERKTVHQNPFFSVIHEHIEVSGEREDFYIVHKDHFSVFVVPVMDEKILLINQYRQHIRASGWEIPAGGSEALEQIAEAARRELEEETGYGAGNLQILGNFFPVSGLADTPGYAVLASNLEKTQRHQDHSEHIKTLQWFDYRQVKQMIQSGDIIDGPTICALHYFFLEHA